MSNRFRDESGSKHGKNEYQKMKVTRVKNGFQVFARGDTSVFSDKEPEKLISFITEWVSGVVELSKKTEVTAVSKLTDESSAGKEADGE